MDINKKLKFRKIEYAIFAIVIMIFSVVFVKYYAPEFLREIRHDVSSTVRLKVLAAKSYLQTCADGEEKYTIPGGRICAPQDAGDSAYAKIFTTYPHSGGGKEIMYDFLDEGEIETADLMLQNKIAISRYDPITLEEELTWEEDPYDEQYWRFVFYSMRPTRHLLYAARETGKQEYFDKLKEITESFIDVGMEKETVWVDPHAVAFRSMVLTNTWWKLREYNQLDYEFSTKLLRAIERHGEHLVLDENYQPYQNHGVNQSAALLLLPVNYPHLSRSYHWYDVAVQRVNESIDQLVDSDGVLVENSPYYHFYTLDKFWEINAYTKEFKINIDPSFGAELDKMVEYGTYVLQPDQHIPLLGASIDNEIYPASNFKEIYRSNPHFRYVLSQGREGRQPEKKNVYLPTAGQTIMRSGWGRGNEFTQQTQLIFDVGPYRTSHSDLDALSFNLYANGTAVLPDSGLYTYEKGKAHDYFHGTRSHNTVVVDGQDQLPWSAEAGELYEGDGYVYQSAKHNLYHDVTHNRTLMLLHEDVVVVIDRLTSTNPHTYEQMFHFSPGAEVTQDGLTLTGKNADPSQTVTITQLAPEGISVSTVVGEDLRGWCSKQYEIAVPCYEAAYKQEATTATFVTLIQVGAPQAYAHYDAPSRELAIQVDDRQFEVTLSDMDNLEVDGVATIGQERFVKNRYQGALRYQNGEWIFTDADGVTVEDIELSTTRDNVTLRSTHNVDAVGVEIENVGSYYANDVLVTTDMPVGNNASFKFYEHEDVVPIWGYHNVLTDETPIESPTLDIHVSDFDRQVKFATEEMDCRWLPLAEVVENYLIPEQKIPVGTCVMNFDDGTRNQYVNGLPVLEKYGARATYYIIAGRLDSTDNYMTWAQTDELFSKGHEIGSHTVDSGGLITAGWSREQLEYQLQYSKQILETRGYHVSTFAYPWGEFNEEIKDVVIQSGYVAGRENEKDNKWRDRRPVSASYVDDYLYRLYYYKPELKSNEEIQRELGYSYWWQFEEEYILNQDYNSNIEDINSIDPTSTSYAVTALPDSGDSIINKFVVSQPGTHQIEMLVSTGIGSGYNNILDRVGVYVDGAPRSITSVDPSTCESVSGWQYCLATVEAELDAGPHSLRLQAIGGEIRVDKFRVARVIQPQEEYQATITTYDYSSVSEVDTLVTGSFMGVSMQVRDLNPLSMNILRALMVSGFAVALGIVLHTWNKRYGWI